MPGPRDPSSNTGRDFEDKINTWYNDPPSEEELPDDDDDDDKNEES